MAEASTKVQKFIDDNAVMVFSKSYCPHCQNTKKTLTELGAEYFALDLDKEEDGSDLQDALEKITGQRTVPNVLIKKKHIGGNSDIQKLFNDGQLVAMLKESGALKAQL
ncbi:hypothetical protein CDD82_1560 [Ophiocordyceps australis]|uniref:Glutaredoxin domain-containing protein n=1 Tax=Ophiocordyceps australis TaxID=1399860 RepID=A0A2C5ZFI9_9HYPO|nr:hypothetical protein CDD82_1560 [Ophiocordyceps australis]